MEWICLGVYLDNSTLLYEEEYGNQEKLPRYMPSDGWKKMLSR